MIASMYVFNDSIIKLNDLPLRVNVEDDANPLKMACVEKEHIKRYIKKGNQTQTQLALGYGSINTLKKKIAEYKINTEEYNRQYL